MSPGQTDSVLVQASIDVTNIDDALQVGAMALRAGVDWLEVGTPLVLSEGFNALRRFAPAFPGRVIFVDAKLVDSARKSVQAVAELGGHMVSVCGIAADATIREAVAGARDSGIKVVVDLLGTSDPVRRARDAVELGADLVYLHYGSDERVDDPEGDTSVSMIPKIKAVVDVPLGVVTFDAKGASAAVAAGADIVLIGHPYLVGPNAEAMLTDFVRVVMGSRLGAATK